MYEPSSCQNNENRINNFRESESPDKNKYQVIKNMKKNIYQKDINNKGSRLSYYSERNKHKYNKNISEYMYSTRPNKNNNNNFNNHYYKEIVHKNSENTTDNNNEMNNNNSNDLPFSENNFEKQEENENNNIGTNENYQRDYNLEDNRTNNYPQEMTEE